MLFMYVPGMQQTQALMLVQQTHSCVVSLALTEIFIVDKMSDSAPIKQMTVYEMQ